MSLTRKQKAVEALKKVDYPILECVKNLFSDQEKWIQGSLVKKKTDLLVQNTWNVLDPDAYAFCLLGGIRKCVEDDSYLTEQEISYSITNFNDNTNYYHMMDAVNKALKAKEKEMTMEIQEKELAPRRSI